MKNKSKSTEGKGIILDLKKMIVLLQLENNDVHQLFLDKRQTLSLIGFLKLVTNDNFELSDRIKEIKNI